MKTIYLLIIFIIFISFIKAVNKQKAVDENIKNSPELIFKQIKRNKQWNITLQNNLNILIVLLYEIC